MLRTLSITFAGLVALALGQPAISQVPTGCLGDDGFAASCCVTVPPASANLPALPFTFQLNGQFGCLFDCNLEADYPVSISWDHYPLPYVDLALMPIGIFPSSALSPGFSGTLLAKYSRTWTESIGPLLPERQVWRFLVNGDLTPSAGLAPCPLPPHPATMLTHFTGHVDYACEPDPLNPGAVIYRAALSLHHLPGCISHHPFSAVPLTGAAAHPARSYHLVAPSPFLWQPAPEPQGLTPAEAVRSSILYGPVSIYDAVGEGSVSTGSLTTTASNWLCVPGTGGPFAWKHQTLAGSVGCTSLPTSPYSSIALPPTLSPLSTGYATLPLGRWAATPGTFPGGNRELAVSWGILGYSDSCNFLTLPIHFVAGISTSGVPGMVFNPTPGALGVFNTFLDLQNMLLASGSTAFLSPGFGALFLPRIVWNLNLP